MHYHCRVVTVNPRFRGISILGDTWYAATHQHMVKSIIQHTIAAYSIFACYDPICEKLKDKHASALL